MEEDSGEDQRGRGGAVGVNAARERKVAGDPAGNAGKYGDLVAKASQEEGQEEKENNIRDLGERGLHEHVLPLQLREVDTEIHEVEIQRDVHGGGSPGADAFGKNS